MLVWAGVAEFTVGYFLHPSRRCNGLAEIGSQTPAELGLDHSADACFLGASDQRRIPKEGEDCPAVRLSLEQGGEEAGRIANPARKGIVGRIEEGGRLMPRQG